MFFFKKKILVLKVHEAITLGLVCGGTCVISPLVLAENKTLSEQQRANIAQLSLISTQANEQPFDQTKQIKREEIDRLAIVSASDLLRGVAGVQVGDSRNGGGLDVNIRGIQGQGRVAVTVDGAQQSLDTYRGYGGTQQRSYIDPDLISSLQITKGVNSASTPVGGIGGTVAMQTLTVEDVLLKDRTSGFRITGNFLDNSIAPQPRNNVVDGEVDLRTLPHKGRGNFFNNSAKSGTVAFASKSNLIDFVGAYAYKQQGNYFSGKKGHNRYRVYNEYGREENSTALSYAPEEEVLNTSAETESLLLKTILRPKEDHELELGYRYFDGKYGEIMPSDIFRTGNAGIYQYPSGQVKINTLTSKYTFNPKQNDLIHLTANLWWNDAKTDQLNGSFFVPKSQKFITDRAWVRMDNERIGGDLSNTFKFDSSYGVFKLNLGGSFQHENLSPQKSVYTSNHDRFEGRVLRDGVRNELNMNAQLEYQPTANLTVWTGLKYAKFDSKDRNSTFNRVKELKKLKQVRVYREGEWGDNMYWFPDENGQYTDKTDPRLNNHLVFSNSNNPLDGVLYNDYRAVGSVVYDEEELEIVTGFEKEKNQPVNKDQAITPSFGIEYKVLPQTALFASYTEGTRMPSLFDTTLGTHQVSPIVGLKPEKAKSIEVGISTQFNDVMWEGDVAFLKFSYFDSKIKNFITRYYDPSTFGAMYMTNADRYAVKGFELSSNYKGPRFFTDFSANYYLSTETCDASFAASLRRTANEYVKTHDTPNCTPGSFMGSYTNTQNPPKFSANFTVGQYFLDQKLTLGGRVIYSSGPTERLDKPWQSGATTPQIEYQPVTLVDAFLTYQLNQHLTMNASIQNLTNRYYLDALAQSFMPSPGRTFKTGFVFKF